MHSHQASYTALDLRVLSEWVMEYHDRIRRPTAINPAKIVKPKAQDFLRRLEGDKTKLTLRMLFASADAREHVAKKYGVIEGGNQTLDRLTEHLAKSAAG